MSTFFGVRQQKVDEKTLLAHEYEFLKNEVEPLIAGLRELGVYLPERDMVAPEVWSALGFEMPKPEAAPGEVTNILTAATTTP